MMNPAANSTKEMAPGTCHDTLDDLFGYHNWQKTVNLGESLQRKYFLAVVESRRHKELHEEYTETIGVSTVEEWTQMVVQWEADKSKDNPYVSTVNCKCLSAPLLQWTLTRNIDESEHHIKLKLIEAERVEERGSSVDRRETSVGFLTNALILKESQYVHH